MSFEWTCGCGTKIIVPYESPEKMSSYSSGLCPKCYKKARIECVNNPSNKEYLKEQMAEYQQDNGDPMFSDMDGMYFLCRYKKEDIKMEVYKKLMKVQSQLKAPKSQFNNFGKYSYRNCEDILEAAKPLLAEVGAVLTISDAVINIEQRFYIEATAKFIDAETGDVIENKALAREDETKKGMDLSQVTGSTSSYARKYALNGLFCIDDTKDSDATNTGDKTHTGTTGQHGNNQHINSIDEIKVATIKALATKKGITEKYICSVKKINSFEELTLKQWQDAMKWLDSKEDKAV